MPLSPVLNISRLDVRREIPILRGIDWTVNPGERWALLGPNGSGKTSLLSALTAYLTPTSGRIEVLGKVYGESDWRELRKEVGLVSSSVQQMLREDETALRAVASGREAMINYWGSLNSAEEKKALKILRDVEALKLKDRPWGYLSQGERQRVMIGRALMADFKLLFLDEPCAGLDLVARERFLNFLGRLAKRKGSPALVLVTHHVEEILPFITHVLLLKEGRVVASGKKKAVLNSKTLSLAFGAATSLTTSKGRYFARLKSPARRWQSLK